MGMFSLELPEDEEVMAVLYEHWARFLPTVLFVLFLILPVVWGLMTGYVFRVDWGMWAAACWLVVCIALLVILWLRWRTRVFVFTSKHIIDVDRGGFWNNHVLPLPYSRISDIVWRKHGIGGWLFGYGEMVLSITFEEDYTDNDEEGLYEEFSEGGVLVLRNIPSVKKVYEVLCEMCQVDEGLEEEFEKELEEE